MPKRIGVDSHEGGVITIHPYMSEITTTDGDIEVSLSHFIQHGQFTRRLGSPLATQRYWYIGGGDLNGGKGDRPVRKGPLVGFDGRSEQG